MRKFAAACVSFGMYFASSARLIDPWLSVFPPVAVASVLVAATISRWRCSPVAVVSPVLPAVATVCCG